MFVISALCQVPFLHAESGDAAARARIDQRISQIDALKIQGAVGENNRGFLEARSGGSEVAAVVAAENKDREVVYATLAQKTGSTPEKVGQTRARYIAQHSTSGVWIQDESGQWKKK